MVRAARVVRRSALLLCALGLLLVFAGGTARGAGPQVVVLPTTGIVDSIMASYLRDGIAKAARDGASAVVVKLNTPGGSLEATNDIVTALLDAPLPTIVWVAPAGGRAASAGTFITEAAALAYMAPATNIGAASPVGAQGEDITGTEGQKVMNDAIAKMRSIAEARGRNVDWAVSTVEKAVSSSAEQALAARAIDGIAGSLEEVLRLADGKVVTVAGSPVTVVTAGATSEELGMNPFQGFLHLLSDPNIAFVLFSAGSLGLLFELQNPNFVTGILGAICLILAFIGFGSLPLNVAGLLLIGLALVLILLETQVTSHGLLAVGAIVCFFLGAAALYTEPGSPTAPSVEVALPVILVMTSMLAGFAILVTVTAWRIRRMVASPVLVGSLRVVGETGTVGRPLEPVGSVLAAGEEWSARSADGRPLPRGARVRVVGQERLTLIVEPADAGPPGAAGA
jgi:membrane-bound serine protease (ClpP class)